MIEIVVPGLAFYGPVARMYEQGKITKTIRDKLYRQFDKESLLVLLYDLETKTFKLKEATDG